MKLRVSPLVSLVALLLVFFSPILQANSEDSGNSPKFNEVFPNFKDISYGSHPKELINFWQFDSDQPVGVLLQIHGGGWMGGKKDEVLRPHQLKQGYHIASISYPLVNEGGKLINGRPRRMHSVDWRLSIFKADSNATCQHQIIRCAGRGAHIVMKECPIALGTTGKTMVFT